MCPFNNTKKSDRAKKSKRNEQKTTEEKKKRNENVTAKKTVATTQNPRGEGKLGQTTQSATKNKVLLCFVHLSLPSGQSKAKPKFYLCISTNRGKAKAEGTKIHEQTAQNIGH